ncbi:MAG TPA: peptide chain release factor N(5)-glutamine methyltransferase [Solirubrobacteraceae bacterium]|nr:peptide chain release factor N(5)-glutamine methyltransferase [Solirubrobacteraceae bacterium]
MSLGGVPVRDALDSAVVALAAAGVDTPRLDAEVLLAHVLGVDRVRLVVDRDLAVEGGSVRAFQDAVRRRAVGREPVAYITGVRGFRRLDLCVDGRVLIPRPETETLVEAALDLPCGARVVDVGTGSGAVALALKDERPDLDVVATDAGAGALAVARANAARLGLDVAFVEADLLDGVRGAVDAVVSNPPYVEDGAPLQPEIARHEPPAALYAGPDGLAVIRRLAAQAGASAASFVALEVGMGQAAEVEQVLRGAGFAETERRPDLGGIDRVVVGRR